MGARKIEGCVYRVRSTVRAMLVEVSEENPMQELAEFCAELTREGFLITSISHVFASDTSTPRVAVLSTPEYKDAVRKRKHNDADPDWCYGPCDSRSRGR